MAAEREKDPWSSDAYQKAAAFVPKLATKVVSWLDTQPDDKILDIGCGDGILTCHIAQALATGHITGLDRSPHMISAAKNLAHTLPPPTPQRCTFHVLDAHHLHLPQYHALHLPVFDKVFSNAALHWILHDPTSHGDGNGDSNGDDDNDLVFRGIHSALQPNGLFVFEMGGQGNVAEMRAALTETVAKRVGERRAREADPWFFPDEAWMRGALRRCGFVVVRMECEERVTRVEGGEGREGGVEGWVRLMGGAFFDAVAGDGEREREECIREVVERLLVECRAPDGGHVIKYIRLRAVARKAE